MRWPLSQGVRSRRLAPVSPIALAIVQLAMFTGLIQALAAKPGPAEPIESAAPAPSPAQAKPEAKSGSGGTPRATSAKPLRLRWADLLDQNDGQKAFRMLVPSNWRAGAIITYRMDRPVAPVDIDLRAWDPKSLDSFRLAPQISATWAPSYEDAGLRQNLGYDVIRCPEEACEFLFRVALPRLHPELKGQALRVIDNQQYPEAAAALKKAMPPLHSGSAQVQVARIRVEYSDPQTMRLIHEDISGALYLVKSPNQLFNKHRETIMTWLMEKVFVNRAAADQLGRNADLYRCIASSVRPDPAWMGRLVRASAILKQGALNEQEEILKRSAIIAKNGREIAGIIKSTYEASSKTHERAMDQWAQAIRGTQKYVSPHETTPVELPGGYECAWTTGAGEYLLSNDPSFDPNTHSNVTWELMKRAK